MIEVVVVHLTTGTIHVHLNLRNETHCLQMSQNFCLGTCRLFECNNNTGRGEYIGSEK